MGGDGDAGDYSPENQQRAFFGRDYLPPSPDTRTSDAPPPRPRFKRSVMIRASLSAPRADYTEPYTAWYVTLCLRVMCVISTRTLSTYICAQVGRSHGCGACRVPRWRHLHRPLHAARRSRPTCRGKFFHHLILPIKKSFCKILGLTAECACWQMRVDRTGDTDVRRCSVANPSRASSEDRALPSLPDIEQFSFAGDYRLNYNEGA